MLVEPLDNPLSFLIFLGLPLRCFIGPNVSKGHLLNALFRKSLHESEAQMLVEVIPGCLSDNLERLGITHSEQKFNIGLRLPLGSQQKADIEKGLPKRTLEIP